MYDVRLLGPIEVVGPGGRAALVGVRQRTLIALLALRPGVLVTTSRLIEGMWGEDAPRTAQRTLHSHFARVRQALTTCGFPDVLSTTRAGHVFDVGPGVVDVHRFTELSDDARTKMAAGDVGGAVASFRAGLDQWRGDPLQDGEPSGWATGEVDRLADARLSTLEDWCDGRLRLGDHTAVTADLRTLLLAQPFRERVVGMLMLALYRDGRPAEALDVYHRLREHLGDVLGVSPSAELQRLYTSVLRQEPSLDAGNVAPVVNNVPIAAQMPCPAELPPKVGHFSGRDDELSRLDQFNTGSGERVVLITGSAGMGKSALAIEWAHHRRDRFPDGQIYLDLAGHAAQTALPVVEVLTHAVRALGVAPDRIPAGLPELVTTYRSLLHGRRVLLVLDNAHCAEQISPMVPADQTSFLLVTSRQDLVELSVRHAVRLVELEPLPHADSLALLRSVVGAQRLEREPAAADELTTLCAGMPLALRIVAAKLASRPKSRLSGLAADLAEQRLNTLSMNGDPEGIRAVFDTAYRDLSDPTARIFRLLGLHPGMAVASHTAAAMTGTPLAEVNRHLDELTTAHLTEQVDDNRYRFHDLIRWYANECAVADEPAERRAEALDRLFDWYLGVADETNRILDPRRTQVKAELRYELTNVPFDGDREQALSFIDSERSNLGQVVTRATELGHHVAAWQITFLLATFYDHRGHWDRAHICRQGIAAARALHDPFAEGLMRNTAGTTAVAQRRFEEALDQLEQTVALTMESGDEECRANAYNNMAVALTALCRFDQALTALERALEVFASRNLPLGSAMAHNNMADIYVRKGQINLAFAHLDQAVALVRPMGNPRLEALIVQSRGEALARSGDYPAAIAEFEDALARRRAIGDKWWEANVQSELASVYLGQGAASEALGVLREMLATSRAVGSVHLEAVALGGIGRAYLSLGDLMAAGRHLQAALTLRQQRVPDAEEESQLRVHLSELGRRLQRPSSSV